MADHVPAGPPRVTRGMIEGWIRELEAPSRERALSYLSAMGPVIVGRRGYYRDALGAVGTNERGIFDDAIVVVGTGVLEAFNANTDPALFRVGMATLVPGVWHYQLGTHNRSKAVEKQYQALVQAADVTKEMDGATPDAPRRRATGLFGINIHRAGNFETLSEGCQTIYRPQWETFLALVKDLMREAGATTIPYILTARTDVAGAASSPTVAA
jgi:hypothetical protein